MRFQEQLVRSYVLAYTRNEFGQPLLSSFTEKDAAGAVFYAYTFSYHSLPERRDGQGVLIGYDAFGEAAQRWDAPSSPGFKGLQTSVNFSAGGSLYVGVEISLSGSCGGSKSLRASGFVAGLIFQRASRKKGFRPQR